MECYLVLLQEEQRGGDIRFHIIVVKRSIKEPEVSKRLQQSLDELNSVISYIQRTVE